MSKTDKPYIYVCSPYGGKDENYERARIYARYVLNKGGVPIIPHTMMHGILNDCNPAERDIGLALGHKLLKLCNEVWVFGKELSRGMDAEVGIAVDCGIPVRYIDITQVMGADKRTDAIRKCVQHYEKTYCNVNRVIMEEAIYYLDNGIEPDLICKCIDIAASKDKKWPYAKGILKSCLEKQILSLKEFDDQNRNREKTEKKHGYAAYDLELFEKMLNED